MDKSLLERIEVAHQQGGMSWGFHSRVSVEHRYVCMTVPKVACTTLKRTLHHFEGQPLPEDWDNIHDQGRNLRLSRFTSAEVSQMLLSEDWLRFAFVRNPYDRLLSAWKSKIANHGDAEYRRLREQMRDACSYPISEGDMEPIVAFGDFVRFIITSNNPSVRLDGHWDLQTNILHHNLIPYDVIGRFERFAEDFTSILSRLGAPDKVLSLTTEVTNPTPRLPLAAAYDRELADIVYLRYQPDFDAFGYDRDSWMFLTGQEPHELPATTAAA